MKGISEPNVEKSEQIEQQEQDRHVQGEYEPSGSYFLARAGKRGRQSGIPENKSRKKEGSAAPEYEREQYLYAGRLLTERLASADKNIYVPQQVEDKQNNKESRHLVYFSANVHKFSECPPVLHFLYQF